MMTTSSAVEQSADAEAGAEARSTNPMRDRVEEFLSQGGRTERLEALIREMVDHSSQQDGEEELTAAVLRLEDPVELFVNYTQELGFWMADQFVRDAGRETQAPEPSGPGDQPTTVEGDSRTPDVDQDGRREKLIGRIATMLSSDAFSLEFVDRLAERLVEERTSGEAEPQAGHTEAAGLVCGLFTSEGELVILRRLLGEIDALCAPVVDEDDEDHCFLDGTDVQVICRIIRMADQALQRMTEEEQKRSLSGLQKRLDGRKGKPQTEETAEEGESVEAEQPEKSDNDQSVGKAAATKEYLANCTLSDDILLTPSGVSLLQELLGAILAICEYVDDDDRAYLSGVEVTTIGRIIYTIDRLLERMGKAMGRPESDSEEETIVTAEDEAPTVATERTGSDKAGETESRPGEAVRTALDIVDGIELDGVDYEAEVDTLEKATESALQSTIHKLFQDSDVLTLAKCVRLLHDARPDAGQESDSEAA